MSESALIREAGSVPVAKATDPNLYAAVEKLKLAAQLAAQMR
jgi:hypothetical protein